MRSEIFMALPKDDMKNHLSGLWSDMARLSREPAERGTLAGLQTIYFLGPRQQFIDIHGESEIDWEVLPDA